MAKALYPSGNSVMAIAGKDFVMIAIDKPSKSDSSRHARNQYLLFDMANKAMLGSTVCWCEKQSVYNLLMAHIKYYEQFFVKSYPVECLAPIIARYSPRLLPNYRSNVCVGLDMNNSGAIYYNDSPNHYARCRYYAAGLEGDTLFQLLHNNIDEDGGVSKPILTKDYVICFAVESFRKLMDRSDMLLIYIITKEKVEKYEAPLGRPTKR